MGTPPQRVWVGLDGGSSSLRAAWVDSSGRQLHQSWWVGGTNLHEHDAHDVRQRIADAVFEGVGVLGGPGRVKVAGARLGTAGIDTPADRVFFSETLGRLHLDDLGAVDLDVCSDVEIIAGCGCAPVRVSVIAGTGSNCLAGRYEGGELVGEAVWIGGLDLPLSDWGSAAWLGERALVAALRAANGIDPPGALAAAVFERLRLPFPGGWRQLKPARQHMRKDELAALARAVDTAAEAGDPAATALLDEAGHLTAEIVDAALGRLAPRDDEDIEVLCVGGVLCTNRRVRAVVEAALGARWPRAVLQDADAALGAALGACRAG